MSRRLTDSEFYDSLKMACALVKITGLSRGRSDTISTYAHIGKLSELGTDGLGFSYADRESPKLFSREWDEVEQHPSKFRYGYPLLYTYELVKQPQGQGSFKQPVGPGAIMELEIGCFEVYKRNDKYADGQFDADEFANKTSNEILEDTEQMLRTIVQLFNNAKIYTYAGKRVALHPDLVTAAQTYFGINLTAENIAPGRVVMGMVSKLGEETKDNLFGTVAELQVPIYVCGNPYEVIDNPNTSKTPDS